MRLFSGRRMPKPRQVWPGTFTSSEHCCGRDLHTLTALASSAPSQRSSSSSALREAKGHGHGGVRGQRGEGAAALGTHPVRPMARAARGDRHSAAGWKRGPAVPRGGQGTVRPLRGLLLPARRSTEGAEPGGAAGQERPALPARGRSPLASRGAAAAPGTHSVPGQEVCAVPAVSVAPERGRMGRDWAQRAPRPPPAPPEGRPGTGNNSPFYPPAPATSAAENSPESRCPPGGGAGRGEAVPAPGADKTAAPEGRAGGGLWLSRGGVAAAACPTPPASPAPGAEEYCSPGRTWAGRSGRVRQKGGRWRRGGRWEPPAGSRAAPPGYARAAGPAPELLSGHDGAAAAELQPGRRLPGAAAGVLGAAGGGGGGGECGAPSLRTRRRGLCRARRGVEPWGELWSLIGAGVTGGGILLTGARRLRGRAGVGGEAGPQWGLSGRPQVLGLLGPCSWVEPPGAAPSHRRDPRGSRPLPARLGSPAAPGREGVWSGGSPGELCVGSEPAIPPGQRRKDFPPCVFPPKEFGEEVSELLPLSHHLQP